MTESPNRQPHASLDIPVRLRKACKIERLLLTRVQLRGSRLLEVGTGSGVIASHLAAVVGPEGRVVGVDVVDQRIIREGFEFVEVQDTGLPFPDGEFSIVVSNHVLEHVGDRHAQQGHLREIRRVLTEDGYLYLAVPNRWAVVEPHYRLPFLSWFPRSMRSLYVRLCRRGTHYDCDPPSHGELLSLIEDAGFKGHEVSLEAIRMVAELEVGSVIFRRIIEKVQPHAKLLHFVLPSYIFLAIPARAGS